MLSFFPVMVKTASGRAEIWVNTGGFGLFLNLFCFIFSLSLDAFFETQTARG